MVSSLYSGEHTLVGVGTTTFVFNIPDYPEQSSYTSDTSNLFYETKSSNVSGPISSVIVQNSGNGFETGDKVIYTASSPSGGLVNEKIYYVLYFTRNRIRLCETKYDLNLAIPKYINITSVSQSRSWC